ncbi:MAG: hypothetical protein ACRDO7_10150 [Nocardioidaceae bacterium]
MTRRLGAVAAAALLCVVAACSSDSSADSSADGQRSAAATTGDSDSRTDQSGGADEPDAAQGDTSDGGVPTARWDDADLLEPETALLDWKTHQLRDKGPAAATRSWTGVADALGKRVVITGPGKTLRFQAATGRVQGLEMQWPWAVVYAGGSLTGGRAQSQQGEIAVFDLRDGTRRMVGDEGSAPPPAMAGSVSMHDGELAYATGSNRHYCLAKLDLASLDGKRLRCAEPLKEGFTQFRLTSTGFGYTSFDDRQPSSCMTLKTIRDDENDVIEAAKNCVGWEVVPGPDSDLWLQVRNPNRVEQARAYARTSDGEVRNLGPAMSGSTTWCDGSTYFVRPAQADGRADDLMRWSPESGLDVVWTPQGKDVAFVFAPHCGGSTITIPGFDRDQDPMILSAPTS